MTTTWAAVTDTGRRRQSNEDAYVVRLEIGFFMVADGMGGHVGGEVASRVAVQAVDEFLRDTDGFDANSTWPFPYDPALSPQANRLKGGFRAANRRIGATISEDQDLRGMATTGSALLLDGRRAVIGHVGDSRIYLLRAGALERVTSDHSWVEEQVRAGTMTATAARQHPWRNVVTRALSGGDDPEVDVFEVELRPRDRLLLCSDGLSSVIGDDQIAELLAGRDDLRRVGESLVAAANAAGGPDNITVLVLQVDAP